MIIQLKKQNKNMNQTEQTIEVDIPQSKLKGSKISGKQQPLLYEQLDKQLAPINQQRQFKSRSLKNEDIDKNVYLQQIDNTKSQINSLLQELNDRLVNNYQIKQKQLLQKYKDQLINAHKNLIHLKNNTNQNQIRNQMNERKLGLQKERLQLIQNNMYFSNKCEQLKKVLQNQINQGTELKKQIQFLDKQLQHSALKKVQLLGRLYEKNNQHSNRTAEQKNKTAQLPLFSQKKLPKPQKKTSLSTYSNTKILSKSRSNSQSKFKNSIAKPLFSNDVKKLFQDKLQGTNQNMGLQVSDSLIKVGKTYTKRSIISKQKSVSELDDSKKKQMGQIFKQIVIEIKKKNANSAKHEALIMKGEQFTPIQKKNIMKTFLQNQQVKKQLYSIIFDKLQQSEFPMTLRKKSKMKIALEDQTQNSKKNQSVEN